MRSFHKPMIQTLYYKEIVFDNRLRYSYILSQTPCCPIYPSPDSNRYSNWAFTRARCLTGHKFPFCFYCPNAEVVSEIMDFGEWSTRDVTLDRPNVSMKLSFLQRHEESLAVERNGWCLTFLGQFPEALWGLARQVSSCYALCKVGESLGNVTHYTGSHSTGQARRATQERVYTLPQQTFL